MNIPDAITCFYCHMKHDKVEAGGVWYCPNPLCPGPGGASHRSKCDSYRLIKGDRHTVDLSEWREKGMQMAYATCDPVIISAAIIMACNLS